MVPDAPSVAAGRKLAQPGKLESWVTPCGLTRPVGGEGIFLLRQVGLARRA